MAVVSLTDAHDDNTYVAGNYFGPFAYCSYIQLSSAMILTRARTFGQLSAEFKSQILRLEKSPISERLNIRGRIARQTGLDEEKIAHKQLEAAISNKCCIYRQFLLAGQMAPFPVRRMLHAVTCRFGIRDCKRERNKEFCSTCLVF